jgi:hypothetical protein
MPSPGKGVRRVCSFPSSGTVGRHTPHSGLAVSHGRFVQRFGRTTREMLTKDSRRKCRSYTHRKLRHSFPPIAGTTSQLRVFLWVPHHKIPLVCNYTRRADLHTDKALATLVATRQYNLTLFGICSLSNECSSLLLWAHKSGFLYKAVLLKGNTCTNNPNFRRSLLASTCRGI